MQKRRYGPPAVWRVLIISVLCGCAPRDAGPPTVSSQAVPAQVPTAVDAAIAGFVEDARAGQFGRFDHVVLLRGGDTLADVSFAPERTPSVARPEAKFDYDDAGWHPYYQGSDLHSLQSVTKSITALCVGIAIDEGHIASVHEPAMQWFDAYEPDMADPRRASMTLEDLLTMRSGIDWNEQLPYHDPDNTCTQLEASEDWIRFVLQRPMREQPGTRFDYNSGASVLLGKIVREATGMSVDTYARAKLFEPLGIEQVYWKRTPQGEVDSEGGLYLRAEDLARIGQLMLQRGVWNGRRIVSEAWVDASVTPHVADIGSATGAGYGYQWWIPEHGPDRGLIYTAKGFGGQFALVVPELDLVAVLLAWNTNEPPAKYPAAELVSGMAAALKP